MSQLSPSHFPEALENLSSANGNVVIETSDQSFEKIDSSNDILNTPSIHNDLKNMMTMLEGETKVVVSNEVY